MAMWTCCYDFASLYPTTMRQFNISADSYKGFVNRDIITARKNQSMLHFDKYKDLNEYMCKWMNI